MPIPGSAATKYRFGPFELDPGEGKLSRNGNPVKVQKLPYRLLVMLVERGGEVVTREEVRQHLWPENTFVEFDNSLGVAIRKVRESLGDDAESPRYVETIQGRGYRFIAPIRTDGPAIPATALETKASVQGVEGPDWRRMILAAVALGGVLVFAGWFWRNQTRARIPERAPVVVGDFANSTGDPLFDGSLRRAVVIQLAQSPYLNILPDRKLEDLLQDLGRSPDDKLSPALALEICQRGKAAAVIAGSIQPTGGAYLLALEADRCADGSSLAHETATVANQKSVLPRLGFMIDDLRRALGESRASLEKFDVPVEQATTSSLEALKAYQLGLELRAHSKNVEARPAFKTAIALDPSFAVAYAQLGSSYSNVGEGQEGKRYFQKAFELRAHATEPERLYIVGRYFDMITNEREKGSETYKLWTELYPDEWRAYNALANNANLLGQYATAVHASKRVVSLVPNHNFGYINLLSALIALNRLDEAKSICDQLIGTGHDDTYIHLSLFSIAILRHDEQALSRESEWTQRHPDDIWMRNAQAEADAAMGKVKESTALLEEVAKRTAASGDSEAAANALAVSAEINSEMGRTAVARNVFDDALKLGKNQIVLGLGALIASRAGNEKRAHDLLDELDHDVPLSTFNMGLYSPMARTTLAAAHGSSASEISGLMEPALPYELGQVADLLPIYVRANSYLQVRSGKEAEREFQKVLDHHGVDAATTLYPLSHLGLARACALQGKKADSRRAYETFFSLWKDADRDLPVLANARREYQELK